MDFFPAFMTGLFFIWVSMTVLWLVSLVIKDASIVDIFWGIGFLIATLSYAANTSGDPGRRLLMVGLVAAWGVRLAAHLARRNLGKGEDYRYAAWRKQYGDIWWIRSYFHVFLLQGAIMWVVSAPVLAAMVAPAPAAPAFFDILGLGFWAVGFFFEAVGDYQLAAFKADPANKGKVMDRGLWRYTRHPNYFGDAMMWWGFYLIALGAGGWWTVFSPLLMTYLLLRVSGVAMLEGSLKQRKPEYAEYIRKTSAFIPMPPKR